MGSHRGQPHNPDSVEGNGVRGEQFDALHAESAENSARKDPEAARVTPRESRNDAKADYERDFGQFGK